MDEPNYRLTDASGNVIGDIGVDANGNPTVEHADSGESVSITEDGLVTPSLSTGGVDFTGISEQTELTTAAIDADNYQTEAIKRTSGVGTDGTTIYDITQFENDAVENLFAMVSGADSSDGSIRFTDIISAQFPGHGTVIAQNSESSPASRSYDYSGTTLELTMGSGSFNILVTAISARVR